jgi:hypothetical protein
VRGDIRVKIYVLCPRGGTLLLDGEDTGMASIHHCMFEIGVAYGNLVPRLLLGHPLVMYVGFSQIVKRK